MCSEELVDQMKISWVRPGSQEAAAPGRHVEAWAPAVTVSERFEVDDDASEAPVLRRRTTLTFGDGGLPLDQLPFVMDDVRTTAALELPQHAPKVGRNAPCPCGSGRKFKQCCGKDRPAGRA